MLSNILCCAPPVSCGQPCGMSLECGHACIRKCHSGPCAEAKSRCTQLCGRCVNTCGHPCQAKCHPATPECPKCSYEEEIRCECGYLKQRMSCAQYLKRLEKHIAEGGDRRYLLTCSSDCIFEQRLNALKSIGGGVGHVSGVTLKKIVLYSVRLWNIAIKNIDAVKSIEASFTEFIKSKENTLLLPPMLREKRAIVHELSLFYHLHCEAIDEEPKRTCFLSKTMNSSVPPVTLSAAVYRDDNNPSIFAEHAMSSGVEMMKRVIQFEGDKLNEITVHHALKSVMGTFVVMQAQGAFMGVSPAMPSTFAKFFAVFPSSVERQHGFAALRKNGCPVLYHLFGEAPPPKRFIWEPDRASAVPVVAAPLPPRWHTDPTAGEGPAAAASSSPLSGQSWSAFIAPKRENAKDKKRKEKEQMPTNNMFSALKK